MTYWSGTKYAQRNKPRSGYANRRAPTVSQLAQKVARMQQGQNSEWKNHDTGDTDVPMTNAGTITLQSDIGQGVTSLERIGLTVKLQSVAMRYKIVADEDYNAGVCARVILFFDTQCDGVLPTVAEVLEGSTPTILDFREHDQKGRFQIIYDKTHSFNKAISGSDFAIFDQYYKKFNGRKMYFTGITSLIASMGKGTLYSLVISDKGTGDYPLFNYQIRLKFTDQ